MEGKENQVLQLHIEEQVTDIWKSILDVDQIDVDTDLFTLGGDSLQAVQIISRVRDTFGVSILLRSLFSNPTISGLAKSIQATRQDERVLTPFELVLVPREGKLPMSVAQKRRWELKQHLHERSLPLRVLNLSRAFRITGKLNVAVLQRCFNEIVHRHEILRTSFPMKNGEVSVSIKSHLSIPLELIKIPLQHEEDQVTTALRSMSKLAQEPFDWEHGPLLRTCLVNLGEAEHMVLIVIDHLICDGWSMKIFLQELTALYDAFTTSMPSPLLPLSAQYVDYVYSHARWLTGTNREVLCSYWRQQLTNCPTFPAFDLLPAQTLDTGTSFLGVTELLTLPVLISDGIYSLTKRLGVTLFTVMLTALKTLIFRTTNESDIGIFSPNANRISTETEALIGWFSSNAFLRTDISGDPSILTVIDRVRETVLKAHDFQGMSLPEILQALNISVQGGSAVVPQVFLDVVQNKHLELKNVQVMDLQLEAKSATRGLSFWVSEQGDDINQAPTIELSVVYQLGRYDRPAVQLLLRHFEVILEHIVTNPGQAISTITLPSFTT